MASLVQIAALAAGVIPFAAASSLSSASCSNTELSCHNSTAVSDLCCFNAPYGLFQQVQFWDTNPSTGPSNSWTIHGLWPNTCSGSYSENCDPSRAYTDITTLLQNAGQTSTLDFMDTYWISDDESNEAFWEHEWGTHGTCINTLDPSCYTNYQTGDEAVDFFVKVVSLFKTLDTYTTLANAGITPSSSTTYALSDMVSAIENSFGAPPVFQCQGSTVYEIFYGFDVQGSVQTGTFVPTSQAGSSTNCPATVSYPPKSGSSSTSGSGYSGS